MSWRPDLSYLGLWLDYQAPFVVLWPNKFEQNDQKRPGFTAEQISLCQRSMGEFKMHDVTIKGNTKTRI